MNELSDSLMMLLSEIGYDILGKIKDSASDDRTDFPVKIGVLKNGDIEAC